MIKKNQTIETCGKKLNFKKIFDSNSDDPIAAKRVQYLSNIIIDMRNVTNQYGVEISANETKAWLAMMEKAQKVELREEDYDSFVSALKKTSNPDVLQGIQNLFQRESPWDT